jgi:tetratricopeptide (TPR) repeat protein
LSPKNAPLDKTTQRNLRTYLRTFPELKTKRVAQCAALILITTIVYLPALKGEFILDDDLLLTRNTLVNSPDGLFRIWFTTEPLDYWPITNSSFWLEWRLWGTSPTGYHVVNLALHLASSFLIWRILRNLSIPGAFVAALLFAIHPVNVESVAWIAQRKNVLALCFMLLSALWYLKTFDTEADQQDDVAAIRRGSLSSAVRNPWYWMSLCAFVVAMLSKGSVVVLPLLLLLTIWWWRGRILLADCGKLMPFVLAGAALTGINVWFQTHGSGEAIRDAGFLERSLAAGAIVWFYLYKALVPINLLFIYPNWETNPRELFWWIPLGLLVLVTAGLWMNRRTRWVRAVLTGWLFFVIGLLPVLGFTDTGFMRYSLVADHYQHIAIIGVIAVFAAGWCMLFARTPLKKTAVFGMLVIVGALATLSYQQSRLYRDPIELYETTLSQNPGNWLLHNNLANELGLRGKIDEAKSHYELALQAKPNYAEANVNLGVLLAREGRYVQAIRLYENALQENPDYVQAHFNLGAAFLETGQSRRAIDEFQWVLKARPAYHFIHYNLGNALFSVGRLNEAVREYEAELIDNAGHPETHNNLGNAMVGLGKLTDAIDHYLRAVTLRPDYADAWTNLAHAYSASKETANAIEAYRATARLSPQSSKAHYELGTELILDRRAAEAIEHLKAAIDLNPEYAEAYANLVVALEHANRKTEAIAAAETALRLAQQQNKPDLANNIKRWLDANRAPGNK